MKKLVALALVLSACGTAKLALLPRSPYNSRDPDLTRPLVPTPGTEPTAERGGAPAHASGGEILPGPIGAAVTGAAVLGWLLGGAAPIVGVYGTFDENAIVDPNASQPQVVPTEQ